MTNREMIRNYNALAEIQTKEIKMLRTTGENLFQGRVKVTYAVKKNMTDLLAALKPYNEAKLILDEEYFKESAGGERRAAKENLKDGKSIEEYNKRLGELLDIDVEGIKPHVIGLTELDGLQLSTLDLEAFMFMIRE